MLDLVHPRRAVTACRAHSSTEAIPETQILETFVSEREEPRPASTGTSRKSWIPPKIDDLPRLENLTLQTTIGPPIDGGSIFP
jgi:hypothetical protein